jgi:hypothetical protein
MRAAQVAAGQEGSRLTLGPRSGGRCSCCGAPRSAHEDLLAELAVTALGNHRLGERAGRRLNLIAGLMMLLLGFVMLLRPDWLARGRRRSRSGKQRAEGLQRR